MIALVYFNVSNAVGRGAGSIGSLLASEQKSFAFYNTLYHPEPLILSHILAGGYTGLMLSVMTLGIDDAIRVANHVRRFSDIPILVGGIGPTAEPLRILQNTGEGVYVCIGEGEGVIRELLPVWGNHKEMRKVRGIAFADAGKMIKNPTYPLEPLEHLPRFLWEMFPREVVCCDGASYVSATRGCPYNCTYCANGVYLRTYGGKDYVRCRPVMQVIEEMEDLKQRYQTEFFYFQDEMALANPDYAEELFGKVKEKLDLPFGIMARPEALTEKIVNMLSDFGCQYVGIGVECGDERFRRTYLNRNMSNEKLKEAFRLTKEVGMFRAAYNMLGFPVENDAELTESTVALLKELAPDYSQFTIFYPFPGTKLHIKCKEQGLIDPERVKETRSYYQESCLKGRTVRPVVDMLDKMFNPNGFTFRK